MHVLILFNRVATTASADELDVLKQVTVVEAALLELGHSSSRLPCTLDLHATRGEMERARPDAVFNLVESLDGTDRLMPAATILLDAIGVPYTGGSTLAMLTTSRKLDCKRRLVEAELPTPAWLDPQTSHWHGRRDGFDPQSRVIVKAVAEHASLGLSDASIINIAGDTAAATRAVADRSRQFGTPFFAEAFVEGREFNLSLLARTGAVDVLPHAEIEFVNFEPGRPRIVGHAAKWVEDSAEYQNTPRCFEFSSADNTLLTELTTLAQKCWAVFGLRGWARVDFRVDADGRPWILEINVNPCLSPDAGFAAAAARAGLSFAEVVQRILDDLNGATR